MKISKAGLLIFVILLTGCAASDRADLPPTERMSLIGYEQRTEGGQITILSAKTFIRRGENGSITIQGRPGISYRATATYKTGGRTVTSLQAKTAGADGRVTWTWTVGPQTAAGTYTITISGGRDTIKTTYTVLE